MRLVVARTLIGTCLPSFTTSTQPLTSALSKSCDAIPDVASPVRLVLPRAQIVLQRLVVGLPASQVLRLLDQFLKDLILT